MTLGRSKAAAGYRTMWNWFLWLVGWDYLTPQGIRFGFAGFIAAIAVLAPVRAWEEVLLNVVLLVVASILVAQAISLGAH
jgi:hypothetical protein